MKRICFFVLVSVFAICGPVYCHTFKATYVSEDGTEVILIDKATGDEWMVQVGDKIDEYRIIQITMDHVTIVHSGENGVVYSTDIPINDEKHTVKISP